MQKLSLFLASLHYAVTVVLVIALVITLSGACWEYSTREYLKGFSDAIVPHAAAPAEKVQAILAWMRDAPRRAPSGTIVRTFSFSGRNPRKALNVDDLMRDCGTAANAFENLADVSGVPARRLLLFDADDRAKHIVTEVFVDGRWLVVDPLFHRFFTGPSGPLTRAELAESAIFQEAIAGIPNYDPDWSFERTAHVRLAALPWIGRRLERALDRFYPQWRESLDFSLLLDRSSFALLAGGLVLLFPAALASLWLWSIDEKGAAVRHVSSRQLSFPNSASVRSSGSEISLGVPRLGAFFRRRARGLGRATGSADLQGQRPSPRDIDIHLHWP